MMRLKITLAVFVVMAVAQNFAEAHNGGNGRHHGSPHRRRHPTPHHSHHGTSPCTHHRGTNTPHVTGSRTSHPTASSPTHPTASSPSHPKGSRPPHPTGNKPRPSSQKPHPPFKPMWFYVKFELPAVAWKKDYLKKESKAFKALATGVMKKAKSALDGLPLKGLKFDDFGKGKKGVVVVLVIGLEAPQRVKQDEMKKKFEAMIKKRFEKVFGDKIIFYGIYPKFENEVGFNGKDVKKERKLRGKIRLTSEKYREEYKDLNSASSNSFTKKFSGTMKRVLFKKNPKMAEWMTSLNVDELTEGSVVVSFTASFKSEVPHKMINVKETLQQDIKENGGKFGEMEADINSLQITEISEEEKMHHHHHHCHHHLTHEQKAAVVVMSLLVLVLFIGGGVWYFQHRKGAKKQNDVQDFNNPIKFQDPVKVATYSVA